MEINKLQLLLLIIFSNFSLCSQELIKGALLYEQEMPQLVRDFIENEQLQLQQQVQSAVKLPQWILESSLDNAPELLKGIFSYLQSRRCDIDESEQFMSVPSFHRFILVGQPGTGKTTLAHAIAHMLGYPIVFTPATAFLGHFRNEAANNIQNFIKDHVADGLHKVIIIDELHKLFEHHASEHADDSQSAATFWLALDSIERSNPNIIIIGTANNVEKLPPEIKSRFSGKIITMPPLDENQKIQVFKNSIVHDQSVVIDSSVDDVFIVKMLQQMQNCSLRDVQLIIDSAKMFYCAQLPIGMVQRPIVLTRTYFQQALDQLKAESQVLQESLSERLDQKLGKWGSIFSTVVNATILIKISYELLQNIPKFLKIIRPMLGICQKNSMSKDYQVPMPAWR